MKVMPYSRNSCTGGLLFAVYCKLHYLANRRVPLIALYCKVWCPADRSYTFVRLSMASLSSSMVLE